MLSPSLEEHGMYCRISLLPHHLLWCSQLSQQAVPAAVAGGCAAAAAASAIFGTGGAAGVLELMLIINANNIGSIWMLMLKQYCTSKYRSRS